MRKLILLLVIALLLVPASWLSVSVGNASPTADCGAFSFGSIPDLSSTDISFTCAADNTVYFGVCDSGSVPNDDLFNITYMGSVVASNNYVGGQEYVTIGTAQVAAGNHVATLNSLSTTPFPPATFGYAISSDSSEVGGYLGTYCGADFSGSNPTGSCIKNVPVFTTDTAPANGTLRFNVLFGEMNREEGITLKVWDITAGQQINNDTVAVKGSKWVRLWWQPDGDSTWYLLTSQYWMGDGTSASEYGIECGPSGAPSYHTSFASAIPAADVPLFHP